MKKSWRLPLAVLLISAAAAVLYALVFSQISAQDLRALLASWGPWAPAGYIALFALLPALFFPVAVLALAGGMCFGLWAGSLYTFVGAMLNCALMFFLARYVGRERIRAYVEARLSPLWKARLDRAAGREGFLLLVILRLIPAVPYNLINYTFGLTDMAPGAYMLASALGIIPGTLVFLNIGDKVLKPGSPGFWLSIVLLAALLALTALLGKKLFPGEHQDGSR